MKGVAVDTLILMIFVGFGILSFVLIVPGMLRDIGRNFCVRDQFMEISKLEEIGREITLGIEKSTGFDVKWCTRCIWFEKNTTHKWLKVWLKDEAFPETWYVENEYSNIGSNQQESMLNNDEFEYNFIISKGIANCTNCHNNTVVGCPQ